MGVRVDRMTLKDVPEVMAIERASFTAPWPSSAYRRELVENHRAHYFVLRLEPPPSPPPPETTPARRSFLRTVLSRFWIADRPAPPHILTMAGYAGLWLTASEAHVTTIGVRPQFRSRGYGELLLVTLIEAALDVNARWLTLEVRVSNAVAQRLYHKYGFHERGRRRRYYTDNNEDAFVMWTDELRSAAFQARYRDLKESLLVRLEGINDLVVESRR